MLSIRHPRAAFTLVELSIVMVIIGLIIGGVLIAQTMVRSSELRSVTLEYARWISAVNNFRDKYSYLPGDMPNATRYWSQATCPGTNAAVTTTSATCNGNGNGFIDFNTNANGGDESFLFWKHLANAGLIEGSYTGVPNSATANSGIGKIGWDLPVSRLSNASWMVVGLPTDTTVSSNTFFEGTYGNMFYFGPTNVGPNLKPEEAWNIDRKVDDGMPATGKVVTWEYDGGICTDLAASTTAALGTSQYVLFNTGYVCRLIFRNNF